MERTWAGKSAGQASGVAGVGSLQFSVFRGEEDGRSAGWWEG